MSQIAYILLCHKDPQAIVHQARRLTRAGEAVQQIETALEDAQQRIAIWIHYYNHQRPHQALNGRYPGDLYTPSARPYRPPEQPDYPYHDRTIQVTYCGRICIGGRKINLCRALAGQHIGVREVADKIWLVSFMDYDLGFFDRDENRVEPVGLNPFAPKVLPMSSE